MSKLVTNCVERQLDGARYVLNSPTAMPNASGFLWNKNMLIQATCRGYALAQFMQPDAGKYVSGPAFEAKTFMQPEQPYYAHHPGRFVYVKDNADGTLFSAPYEPVRAKLDKFEFIPEPHQITWVSEFNQLRLTLRLRLPTETALECWQIQIEDLSGQQRDLSVYPYFPIGYRSWMNQSGKFEAALNTVVCRSVEPYQKVQDYFKHQSLHELTFLASDVPADAWETCQQSFEGEGGLHNPSAIQRGELNNSQANYATPTAVMQFKTKLKANESKRIHLLFGPAKSLAQISSYKSQFLTQAEQQFSHREDEYVEYLHQGKGVLQINTPDQDLNAYVNHWMARQLFYHGDVNRLTTDPQTRNYLQDNMGMVYIAPNISRDAFLLALSQQHVSGEMPDGVLIKEGAELKYINQVPHTDHCVWLPICLKAYLDETGDFEILNQLLAFSDSDEKVSVAEHITRAMLWLDNSRDERGLSYINQGDWCDPMNMVGYKGIGVSAWLSLASAYAMDVWVNIQRQVDENLSDISLYLLKKRDEINQQVNKYCWVEDRFARGITDDGRVFGIGEDSEGKIFLNPQSWALLSGAANEKQVPLMLAAIQENLETPYGCMMLAPCFTNMVEDIGRVTQKFPGSAENGSVYNHASAFYAYSLYTIGESESAFAQLKKMLPTELDMHKKGQLPLFIPNYYRGAYYQFPNEAGKSSHLFNTGTISWFYRCLVECLFGVVGCPKGLQISPQLPSDWQQVQIQREFRGASFNIEYERSPMVNECSVLVNGTRIEGNVITEFSRGQSYQVKVYLPD